MSRCNVSGGCDSFGRLPKRARARYTSISSRRRRAIASQLSASVIRRMTANARLTEPKRSTAACVPANSVGAGSRPRAGMTINDLRLRTNTRRNKLVKVEALPGRAEHVNYNR